MEQPNTANSSPADERSRGQLESHDRDGWLPANHNGLLQGSPTTPRGPKSKTQTRCRYFFGNNGCKAGAACPWRHDAAAAAELPQRGNLKMSHKEAHYSSGNAASLPGNSRVSHEMNQRIGTEVRDEESSAATCRHLPRSEDKVLKPVPESQKADPRQFQLNQLRRRFSPEEKEEHEATTMTFRLVPTDPDFPFEMSDLQCTVLIPRSYPTQGRPSLRINNPEMARRYQINVERGFDSLVTSMPKSTLLSLVNELDKRLEGFLMSDKAPTIKLVANTGKKITSERSSVASAAPPVVSAIPETSSASAMPQRTPQQLAEAKLKRESDVRQLEARMGRNSTFSRSSDGISFALPLHISKSSKLPVHLQSVKSVKLLVPLSYNLEPCTISLVDVPSKEAEAVEASFERHAQEHPEMTLMAHINYLAQNMHVMAMQGPAPAPAPETLALSLAQSTETAVDIPEDADTKTLENRPHVQVIPRPPEWCIDVHSDSGTDSSEDDSSEYETDDDDGGAALPPEAQTTDPGPDLGILITFPSLELYGAELFQLYSISLTVKCDRCKGTKDVKNIRSHTSGESSLIKHESCCNTCANQFRISYRGEPMHSNSIRAGYLDLDGNTVVDLLPSNFIPTCSQCSTSISPPGVVSFRGESTMSICRSCHQKMTFKIPDVKFLRVSAAGIQKNRPLPKKRPKENLGIVSGQELPRRGRCEHYAKSYRWFRFSCCSKVYPCDRCHDAAEEHPNEHANRMICGACSREQVYRPEDCIHCHNSLVRKRGGGFWEGGKGTRDKVRMSRKDPRKYKRRAGGPARGSGMKQ